MTVDEVVQRSAVDADVPGPDNRRSIALAWILLGALWFGLCAFCWSAWVISGDFKPNTIGRSQSPAWYTDLVRSVEVFGVAVTLLILWRFVIRDRMRTGKLSFDGLFFLACWMLFIQEPWINFTSLQFLYSTTFINFGSWLRFMPGWSSPHPELMPVALVWGTAYLWLVAVPAWAGSLLMKRLRSRNPRMGVVGLVGRTFLAFVVFDLVLETLIVRTQLFNYGATVRGLTLFAGTDHQFPVYEVLSWCGTYTGLACLHFFRNDQGLSVVERHIPRLGLRGRANTFVRFLAILGACQTIMLVTYNIPYQLWALHAGPIPQVFQNEPYRMGGLCGPGTQYACPDPRLPIARRGGATNRTS